jgi:hypothetical protein
MGYGYNTCIYFSFLAYAIRGKLSLESGRMGISESFQSLAGKQQLGGSEQFGTDDFMILCPVVAENSGAIEALYALYYLPPNFKLLITKIGIKSNVLFDRFREIMSTESIKDRVLIQDGAGMPGTASPFSTANVVVYGSSDPMYTKDAPQAIIVFDITSKLKRFDGNHNFAVASSNPESVASAILQVARKQQ